MPNYDYQCKKCGKIFEIFQSITAPALEICPENVCEEPEKGLGKVERKISGGTNLIFSGSGFYLTDYARAGSSEKSGEAPTSSPPATPAPKSESKE